MRLIYEIFVKRAYRGDFPRSGGRAYAVLGVGAVAMYRPLTAEVTEIIIYIAQCYGPYKLDINIAYFYIT